jgi:hypothetical protein
MEGCLLQYFPPVFSADWAGFLASFFYCNFAGCRQQFSAVEL